MSISSFSPSSEFLDQKLLFQPSNFNSFGLSVAVSPRGPISKLWGSDFISVFEDSYVTTFKSLWVSSKPCLLSAEDLPDSHSLGNGVPFSWFFPCQDTTSCILNRIILSCEDSIFHYYSPVIPIPLSLISNTDSFILANNFQASDWTEDCFWRNRSSLGSDLCLELTCSELSLHTRALVAV